MDAISKISDIIRYNIEGSQKRFVSLNQELDYIEDYINIQNKADNKNKNHLQCMRIKTRK